MSERQHIEEQIRQVLATEEDAIALSNKLFAPGGLFAILGPTEESRREIVQTKLFKEAQQRLSELQRREAARFAEVVEEAKKRMVGKEFLLKLEPSETP